MSNPPFEHKCKRCDYEWLGKLENPKACPKCNSPYWNKERARTRLPFHTVTKPMDETGRDFVHDKIYTKGVEFDYNAMNTGRKLEIKERDMITYGPEPLLVVKEGDSEVKIFDPTIARYIRYLMDELNRLSMR